VIQIRLKELLKEKDVSMNKLSQMTGLSYVTIWRLSKSDQTRIDLIVLARICDALRCQPGDLLINVKRRK
jgi:putative transcriptional regulator